MTLNALYGIADPTVRPDVSMEEKVRALLAGGASVIQIRMKQAPTSDLLAVTRRAVALAAGRVPILVNDRADVALLAGAAGVHVGAEDLPVAEVRSLARQAGRPSFVVGATVRTLEQARAAARDGADYVGFGPIYSTATKHVDAELRGLGMLREVSAGCPVPVVAIAGITLERAAEVAQAGAAAAAVIGDILGAADIAERARLFKAAFERAKASAT